MSEEEYKKLAQIISDRMLKYADGLPNSSSFKTFLYSQRTQASEAIVATILASGYGILTPEENLETYAEGRGGSDGQH